MKKSIFIILILFLINIFSGSVVYAKHLYLEKEYQASWCKKFGGQMEYVLPDGARVDVLTKEYAVEFDFASKWAESIGQALYYGIVTNKKPAVVLIMENPTKEYKYLQRLKKVAVKHGITVFTMNDLYKL